MENIFVIDLHDTLFFVDNEEDFDYIGGNVLI